MTRPTTTVGCRCCGFGHLRRRREESQLRNNDGWHDDVGWAGDRADSAHGATAALTAVGARVLVGPPISRLRPIYHPARHLAAKAAKHRAPPPDGRRSQDIYPILAYDGVEMGERGGAYHDPSSVICSPGPCSPARNLQRVANPSRAAGRHAHAVAYYDLHERNSTRRRTPYEEMERRRLRQ
jgi:hypothetical protein